MLSSQIEMTKVKKKNGKNKVRLNCWSFKYQGRQLCQISRVTDVHLRTGGRDLKSSGEYPRSYATFIAMEHMKASGLKLATVSQTVMVAMYFNNPGM